MTPKPTKSELDALAAEYEQRAKTAERMKLAAAVGDQGRYLATEIEYRAIAFALRQAAAADEAKPVAVKALNWVKHPHATMYRAISLLGVYDVAVLYGAASWRFAPYNDGEWAEGKEPSEAAALAAAQADYDDRILSALATPPAASDPKPAANIDDIADRIIGGLMDDGTIESHEHKTLPALAKVKRILLRHLPGALPAASDAYAAGIRIMEVGE